MGGGTAGMAAARRAASQGARVVMVTDGPPGGDCTFTGCVPSKTLLEAAAGGARFEDAMRRVRATVARIAASETADVRRGEGVEVLEGRGRVVGPGELVVGAARIEWRRLVVATGSQPAVPPPMTTAGVPLLTNESVFDLVEPPASLLVVGGGPIGVEMAQAFARLGVDVCVVEAADRALPREEPEASSLVAAALRADGVRILTRRQVTAVQAAVGALKVTHDRGTMHRASHLLVAAGRRPTSGDLGLDALGVALDARGWVTTDDRMRTSARGVFAAGDVTGRSAFTHAADEMGRVAATNALARVPYRRFREAAMPAVTYTDPEVARVGCTEAEAAKIPGARVAYLPLDAVDRAVTAGRTDGYIKLIVRPRKGIGDLGGGRVVGATIVASRAGEMLALPTLALATGMLPARLALTVQAYPTWSLGVRQAAGQFFTEVGGRSARPARPG